MTHDHLKSSRSDAPANRSKPLVQEGSLVRRGDERGGLIAIEECEVGFPIKRVYFVYETAPGVARGFHAHRMLQQVVVAVTGSCRFVLDDGVRRESVMLDDPTRSLVIEPSVWHEMHDFSPGCVLAVLASAEYDEADYIRNYDDFLAFVAPAPS
ncbi:MAG TPA: FdtA/QdtA family cupin domain-containing protein [Sphingomonadaceae bacterium]|nr:FdtA/QdtA family cupin domain-containing protein [Sphingomonadaceae bacterium]